MFLVGNQFTASFLYYNYFEFYYTNFYLHLKIKIQYKILL
jgi:hypothetical protein